MSDHTTSVVLARALAILVALAACAPGEVTQPVMLPPDSMLAVVNIEPRVAIIAVDGTLQFNASSRSLAGTTIMSFDSVRFALQVPADSLRVLLTPTGQVTGLAPSSGATHVQVNAYMYKGPNARAGRALVQVTPNEVPGTVLSIQPTGSDSAKLAQGTMKTIMPVLMNPGTGQSVSSPVVWYTVQEQDQLVVGTHKPRLTVPGARAHQTSPSPNPAPNQIRANGGERNVWVHADIDVYGTRMRDSVLYTLTYAYALTITTQKLNLKVASFTGANQVYTLAPGATVTFRNGAAASDPLLIAYAFSDSSAATAATPAPAFGGTTGNVSELSGGRSSTRRFLTIGTYVWTATASGAGAPFDGQKVSGTIVIK